LGKGWRKKQGQGVVGQADQSKRVGSIKGPLRGGVRELLGPQMSGTQTQGFNKWGCVTSAERGARPGCGVEHLGATNLENGKDTGNKLILGKHGGAQDTKEKEKSRPLRGLTVMMTDTGRGLGPGKTSEAIESNRRVRLTQVSLGSQEKAWRADTVVRTVPPGGGSMGPQRGNLKIRQRKAGFPGNHSAPPPGTEGKDGIKAPG